MPARLRCELLELAQQGFRRHCYSPALPFGTTCEEVKGKGAESSVHAGGSDTAQHGVVGDGPGVASFTGFNGGNGGNLFGDDPRRAFFIAIEHIPDQEMVVRPGHHLGGGSRAYADRPRRRVATAVRRDGAAWLRH